MPQPGLVSLLLLLLLGLTGAAPLSKQEVTRCLEEALKDKLSQEGPWEGPCTQLFQEDEQLTSLLQTLEALRHQEISKHHLGPESEAEREEQEVEEEDFRKKKRGPGEVEGEKRLGQEVREEEEEEVKAKEKSEVKEQEVRGQTRVQEEDKRRRRLRRPEGSQGSEEDEAEEGWGQGVEKRVAEAASEEETAQFEEEKGMRVWQGASPANRHQHHHPRPEQESEEEMEAEKEHELARLEQMGEELKRAAEALGRRG